MRAKRSEKEIILDCLFRHMFGTASLGASHNAESFTEEQLQLIHALGRQFGDCGLIRGDQGVIIKHSLDKLGVYDDHRPDLKLVT